MEVRLDARPRVADITCRSLAGGTNKLKADLSLTREVTAVLILNLSTRGRMVVSLTPQSFAVGDMYRGAGKSLARPASRYILFDG